ncbi:MAG: response regulator [Clostridiales bacterium]|nr:response regulator [Clostridiales bacterium]
MLKVIIADDEEQICMLIRALVDWASMDMEIVGIAHNGLEALELVKKHQPDILVTDIRMPGCNGLELIEAVKRIGREIEIVIISGYAEFEYAQSAIKYGVGDYLLKPVNQEELCATLRKLRERIYARRESEVNTLQLIQKSENNMRGAQMLLMESLIQQKEAELSLEILKETYDLKVEPGIFQAFWLKVDGQREKLSSAGQSVVMEKAENLLTSSLKSRCMEILVRQKGTSCIGIMNYSKKKQDEILRILRDCLNQLEAEKKMLGPSAFSLALGCAAEQPEDLQKSIYEASVIIKERLIKGTGRVLERMPSPSSIHEQNFLEKYLRQITHAIELMSEEEAEEAIREMRELVRNVRNVRGYEIAELVHACGSLFISQIEAKTRGEIEKQFAERCEQCGSVEELVQELSLLQTKYIEARKQKDQDEMARYIRQAKQYIQNHYSEQITQEEVSAAVGLCPAYFSRLFKKEEGEVFSRYLTNVRMEQAKTLLRETNYPVAEICRRVGYNDTKHFNKVFESFTGAKPATYRKVFG